MTNMTPRRGFFGAILDFIFPPRQLEGPARQPMTGHQVPFDLPEGAGGISPVNRQVAEDQEVWVREGDDLPPALASILNPTGDDARAADVTKPVQPADETPAADLTDSAKNSDAPEATLSLPVVEAGQPEADEPAAPASQDVQQAEEVPFPDLEAPSEEVIPAPSEEIAPAPADDVAATAEASTPQADDGAVALWIQTGATPGTWEAIGAGARYDGRFSGKPSQVAIYRQAALDLLSQVDTDRHVIVTTPCHALTVHVQAVQKKGEAKSGDWQALDEAILSRKVEFATLSAKNEAWPAAQFDQLFGRQADV